MRRLDYLKESKVRDLVKGSLHPHEDCGLVTLATNQISGYDRAWSVLYNFSNEILEISETVYR